MSEVELPRYPAEKKEELRKDATTMAQKYPDMFKELLNWYPMIKLIAPMLGKKIPPEVDAFVAQLKGEPYTPPPEGETPEGLSPIMTPEMVLQAYRMRRQGMSYRDIGQVLGTSAKTVWQHTMAYDWEHYGEPFSIRRIVPYMMQAPLWVFVIWLMWFA